MTDRSRAAELILLCRCLPESNLGAAAKVAGFTVRTGGCSRHWNRTSPAECRNEDRTPVRYSDARGRGANDGGWRPASRRTRHTSRVAPVSRIGRRTASKAIAHRSADEKGVLRVDACRLAGPATSCRQADDPPGLRESVSPSGPGRDWHVLRGHGGRHGAGLRAYLLDRAWGGAYQRAVERFRGHESVVLIRGDSGVALGRLLPPSTTLACLGPTLPIRPLSISHVP
jgi:hypothetical protein